MFSKKHEENKNLMLEDIYRKNLNSYIDYFKKDVYTDDEKEYIQKIESEYQEAVLTYVRYLESFLTEETINNSYIEDFNIDDLIPPQLCKIDSLKAILSNTMLDGLIYIDSYKTSAHFHVRNMIIEETEFLETLPDLIPELKNQNFNTLFNGRNIVEARFILEQMKVLPKNSELEIVVNNYFITRNIRSRFIESVICMLIINGKDQFTKDRVRILKKASGIYIDISRYLNADIRKLTLKKEDN